MTNPAAVDRLVAAVEATGEPYTIIRDGQPVAVVVDHDRWQAMLAQLAWPACEACGKPVNPAHCVVDANPHLMRQPHWHPECKER